MNKKERKKILIFIDWFLPGFKAGGPIKSVANIVSTLYEDFDFHIITSDRDINESQPYKNVEFNRWIKKETYQIIYLSLDTRDDWIKNHLAETNYHIYYFNSLFSKNYTLKPVLSLNRLNSRKVIIAPRGMLGKGALAIKSFKKKLFLKLAKTFGYFDKIIWHATNEEEKSDIELIFGKSSKIEIASNISRCVIEDKEITKSSNILDLVFFSRISPKKNLTYALNLLVGMPNVSLDIYGSIEDKNYWVQCLEIIKENNLNVTYKGEIIPLDVTTTLSNYHFFILPTLHENYGHVIVEALAAGCGLIISDNTPWILLERKKIGWDINLNNESKFVTTLKYCVSMEQNEYNVIRNNCYNFVRKEINTIKEIEDTKQLFL